MQCKKVKFEPFIECMQTTGWINWPLKPGMQVKLRAFSLSGALSKIRGKWRQHKEDGWYTGRIVIRGIVEITNGKYHQKARNHFVNNGLQALMWGMTQGLWEGNNSYNVLWVETPLDVQTIYLGSDTITKTTPSTIQLVSPIGPAPGTGPNSFARSTNNLSNGGTITFTATWNAGTVSGTIGELGLYAYYGNGPLRETVNYRGAGTSYGDIIYGTQPLGLISRLSVADGDFSAFTINTGYPVTVAWTVEFVFA